MLLVFNVDTNIHINRSHLLASHCASHPASRIPRPVWIGPYVWDAAARVMFARLLVKWKSISAGSCLDGDCPQVYVRAVDWMRQEMTKCTNERRRLLRIH